MLKVVGGGKLLEPLNHINENNQQSRVYNEKERSELNMKLRAIASQYVEENEKRMRLLAMEHNLHSTSEEYEH
jgi:hypothetical protein